VIREYLKADFGWRWILLLLLSIAEYCWLIVNSRVVNIVIQEIY
jgi:hypothetical protein